MKSVVIFGAGASYGSDKNGTPPLGNQLFNSLATYDPNGWGQIAGDMASNFRADFELGMKQLSETNPHALPPLQRAMAAYFFHFQPQASNLYFQFAKKIKEIGWSGLVVTLNYERLLEASLCAAGLLPFVGREPNLADGKIELCLPHGCCHIFCESVRGSANGVSFSGQNVTTNGPVVAIAPPHQFHERIRTDAFPPVMSYFEPTKTTSSGANFVAEQRQRLQVAIGNAEKIAIVGIRVRSHDRHIWGPLSETRAKILYISGPEAAGEYNLWKSAHSNRANDVVLTGLFGICFTELLAFMGMT